MGSRVFGLRVEVVRFRVEGLGYWVLVRAWSYGFGVSGLGSRDWSLRSRKEL